MSLSPIDLYPEMKSPEDYAEYGLMDPISLQLLPINDCVTTECEHVFDHHFLAIHCQDNRPNCPFTPQHAGAVISCGKLIEKVTKLNANDPIIKKHLVFRERFPEFAKMADVERASVIYDFREDFVHRLPLTNPASEERFSPSGRKTPANRLRCISAGRPKTASPVRFLTSPVPLGRRKYRRRQILRKKSGSPWEGPSSPTYDVNRLADCIQKTSIKPQE